MESESRRPAYLASQRDAARRARLSPARDQSSANKRDDALAVIWPGRCASHSRRDPRGQRRGCRTRLASQASTSTPRSSTGSSSMTPIASTPWPRPSRPSLAWTTRSAASTRCGARPNGLMVGRRRIPLGAIGIIYESRPNVTSDAAACASRAATACSSRVARTRFESNRAIYQALRAGLAPALCPTKPRRPRLRRTPPRRRRSGHARPG